VEFKAKALEYGRSVDSEAKRITVEIEAIEDHLMAEQKKVDDEIARIKFEKEQRAVLPERLPAHQARHHRKRAIRAAYKLRSLARDFYRGELPLPRTKPCFVRFPISASVEVWKGKPGGNALDPIASAALISPSSSASASASFQEATSL